MATAKKSGVDREGTIASRAYELFEARGSGDGRDWEDWLDAEQSLILDGTIPDKVPAGSDLVP